ncbi:MAG TPA: hypothetical protein VM912_02280, partial [Terriglobales bacterium]|nr:hypothetical protein [Terriglobales bacterium]
DADSDGLGTEIRDAGNGPMGPLANKSKRKDCAKPQKLTRFLHISSIPGFIWQGTLINKDV